MYEWEQECSPNCARVSCDATQHHLHSTVYGNNNINVLFLHAAVIISIPYMQIGPFI